MIIKVDQKTINNSLKKDSPEGLVDLFTRGVDGWWFGYFVKKTASDHVVLKVNCSTGVTTPKEMVTSLVRYSRGQREPDWFRVWQEDGLEIRCPEQDWLIFNMDTMASIAEVLNKVLFMYSPKGAMRTRWSVVLWEADEPGRYELYLCEFDKPRYLITGKWLKVK